MLPGYGFADQPLHYQTDHPKQDDVPFRLPGPSYNLHLHLFILAHNRGGPAPITCGLLAFAPCDTCEPPDEVGHVALRHARRCCCHIISNHLAAPELPPPRLLGPSYHLFAPLGFSCMAGTTSIMREPGTRFRAGWTWPSPCVGSGPRQGGTD